jgi:hypothetical protein
MRRYTCDHHPIRNDLPQVRNNFSFQKLLPLARFELRLRGSKPLKQYFDLRQTCDDFVNARTYTCTQYDQVDFFCGHMLVIVCSQIVVC